MFPNKLLHSLAPCPGGKWPLPSACLALQIHPSLSYTRLLASQADVCKPIHAANKYLWSAVLSGPVLGNEDTGVSEGGSLSRDGERQVRENHSCPVCYHEESPVNQSGWCREATGGVGEDRTDRSKGWVGCAQLPLRSFLCIS